MYRLRQHRDDLIALAVLLVLPMLWFAPVLFPFWGGSTLLPYDNLYTFEPWRSLQPDLIPHNGLLSDLVLENAVWKLHIRQSLAAGQPPLWNPQIFTGVPFLAAGQSSPLYPLSLLFYILPLETAYGWFTALQLALAGINMYALGRALWLRPPAALFSGVVFMFSGFMIVSVVFTMVIAAAAWLPLLLAIIELIVRKQEEKGNRSFRPVPYVVAGAAVIGITALAGHPEFYYYTLLVAGMYSVVRLIVARQRLQVMKAKKPGTRSETVPATRHSPHATRHSPLATRHPPLATRHPPLATRHSPPATRHSSPATRLLKLAGWLLAMALLGVTAGAVQLLPLFELVTLNFRQGSASYRQVVEWAWPSRHILTFLLPDVFGNPSHHAWFDLWNGRRMPATVNALDQPNHTIFWGIKNYVEGGNYVGVLTWLLAAVAGLAALPFARGDKAGRRRDAPRFTFHASRFTLHASRLTSTWIFAGLATLSLLFAFGTPLYALLFYGLPGWNQLHSPFRWVFPLTVSMAALGGLGLQALLELRAGKVGGRGPGMVLRTHFVNGGARLSLQSSVFVLSLLTILAGLAALLAVAAGFFLPGPFIALSQRIVDSSDLAQMAFADGHMFWGYQALNLARFGLFAAAGGLLVWWLVTNNRRPTTNHPFPHPLTLPALLAVALVVLDLYAVHGHFNPAADPALSPLNEANRPPVVDFIQEREAADTPLVPWRFTTFNLPGEKTFNANVGMYYGWHDVRGYDSIIPRQYVALMERIAPQSGELLYNRIAPLYANVSGYKILDNPLLDLLNVKYVLTRHAIPNPGWTEVYADAAIRVYENDSVMPRVFMVPEAQVLPAEQQPLLTADLRRTVFLEETPGEDNALVPSSPQLADARISRYTANDVFVDVNLSDRSWLVLTDAYFPGWKAFLRPFGGSESDEQELTIYRADGAFRAVYLPRDGQWTVRFVYSPMGVKLGLYTSFLAGMASLLLLLWWGWGRYYRPQSADDEARTVAKNSLVPMGLSLANKAIDFAFAMLYVRLLGPDGTGRYAFVVTVYGFFEIVSRYGLGTLLTRDVAADKNQSSRYLTNVLALRVQLWAASVPVLALVTAGYWFTGKIAVQEVQAIAIFGVAMLFANVADALSSVFNAFEKMEYPAGLASTSALIKVTLGALVLLLGWGFVGLAGVSLFINMAQVLWLYSLLRRTLFRPQWRWDRPLQRWMLGTSGPLMINHLLATIFWRIDLWILRPIAGAFSVGIYSAALKYLDGLNIIPSTFTFAVFPLMSRYARHPGAGLLRSYRLSVRLLLMVSLPLALTLTFLAEPLIFILGGSEYLNVPGTFRLWGWEWRYMGGSALALQVIIWSIPVGFVNSVTQYVLIAVNQQRYLTRAFIVGVIFNVVGNLLLVPGFGYIGAAAVTILSEFSLLVPFYISVRRNVGVVPWWSLFWRPLVATAAMAAVCYGLADLGLSSLVGILAGWPAYVAVLGVLGGFQGEDMAIVGRALSVGPLRRWYVFTAESAESAETTEPGSLR